MSLRHESVRKQATVVTTQITKKKQFPAKEKVHFRKNEHSRASLLPKRGDEMKVKVSYKLCVREERFISIGSDTLTFSDPCVAFFQRKA